MIFHMTMMEQIMLAGLIANALINGIMIRWCIIQIIKLKHSANPHPKIKYVYVNCQKAEEVNGNEHTVKGM